jgi:hypothetical protein
MIQCFAEDTVIADTLSPAADAGGRTGTYVSLKNALKAWIVYFVTQGNAATVALTPQQASDVSGTAAKAIPTVPIWADQDTAASSVTTRQTDGATLTTSAAVKHKMVIFEIDPAKLDTANGFIAIAAQTGASNAANITSAFVVIAPRYPANSQSAVNAMVN